MKHLHLTFVALVFISFVGRIALAQLNPELLKQKWLKIAPHVIDTLLLLSGLTLVFKGNWLAGDFGWIVAKIIVLVAYIGLATIALRREGQQRLQAAAGAIICLLYIVGVAVTKNALLFF